MSRLLSLFLLFTLFSGIKVKATHITGGEISYECVGQDSFWVTTTLYRDCGGVAAPTIAAMDFVSSCGSTLTMSLAQNSSAEISQLCPTQIANSTCSGGTYDGSMRYVYSGLVVLSPQCSSWTMSWTSCCRPGSIDNLVNPGSLNTYIYSQMNSVVDSCNSSPIFSAYPAPTVFMNQLTEFNLGAYDPDGDSLVYFLSPGFENSTTLVPYLTPYAFNSPLPGNNAVFNAFTGQLSFTPTSAGKFSVVVRVEEYDRATGVYKGAVLRDFIVIVANSTQAAPSFGANAVTNLGDGTFANGALTVCVGDSVDINISVSDTNTADIVSLVTNFESVFDSTAVISVTGTNPAVMNIKWLVQNTNFVKQNFIVQATDQGCPWRGLSIKNFEVEVVKSAFAGEDKNICAGDSVILSGIGGSSNIWTVINGAAIDTNPNSANYNMTCSTCLDTKVFPTTSTTYVLVTNLSGGCKNLDTVIVNVHPDFSISVNNDTSICAGNSLPLFVNTNNPNLNYTYKWSPDYYLSADSIFNPLATPFDNKTYSVSVMANGCSRSASVDLDVVKMVPVNNQISGDSVICSGGTLPLTVTLGSIANLPCAPITNGSCTGLINSTITLGDSATANTEWSLPAPFRGAYASNRTQMLFLASELTAKGMNAGVINGFSLDNLAVGSVSSFANFEVKIKCTSSVDLIGAFESGLVSVYSAQAYNINIGWNDIVFNQGYVWDGVSNLVIEVCFTNSLGVGNGTAFTKHSPTSFTSSRTATTSVGSNCGVLGFGTPSHIRPNVKFDFCSGIDTNTLSFNMIPSTNVVNGNTLNPIVSPNNNTTYQMVVSDTGGNCFDTTSFNVIVSTAAFDASFQHDTNYCINSGVQTFLPIVSGGIFTGVGVSSNGVFDPAAAGVGTWPINYNIPQPATCSSDSTININVIPLPDASIDYTEVCIGSSPFALSAATAGGTWSSQYILDPITGIFDPTGLPAGNYEVIYTLNSPCYSSDTSMVRIIEPFQFLFTSNTAKVCEGDVLDISSYIIISNNPLQGQNYKMTYSTTSGAIDSNGVFNSAGLSTGFYSVSVGISDLTGNCGTSQNITVEVISVDYATIIDEPTYCISQNDARIFVNPWMYGTGMTFSQRPLGSLGATDTLDIYPYGQNGQFNPQTRGEGSWEITYTYINVNGCTGTTVDTIYVLASPDTSVTNNGLELTANSGSGYQYQWLDCNNNMQPISGATSSTYVPGMQGSYAVEVKAGNCIETSGCHDTWPVGLNEINALNVKVFPNPVENYLYLSFEVEGSYLIEVLDNIGKVVFTTTTTKGKENIRMGELPSGVYFVKVTSHKGSFTERIVKE
ncbi:MAG: T9SS type A sorting domain-containing protein [Salibacteraceae bacterium]